LPRVILRCTTRLLDLLRADESMLVDADPSDEDWYANLLWIDRRKCLLLTHAGTLFPVFIADVRARELKTIGSFVIGHIDAALADEGFARDALGVLDPASVRLARTASRQVLGFMNDTATMCRNHSAANGGLAVADLRGLNRQLRRTLHSRGGGYMQPLDLVEGRRLLDRAVRSADAATDEDVRARRVLVVLDTFFEERERARRGDHPPSARLSGADVIYGNPLTTIGDCLVEAISSGATALADRPTDATTSDLVNLRLQYAQYTKLSALATIAAIEMLAQHTGEPKLSERDWITRCAVGEAVAAWNEIRDERNGLEYAVASWLTQALRAYLINLETGSDIEPMEIAKWLLLALAWTAGELAIGEDVPQTLQG
jgi:hypothetical protein